MSTEPVDRRVERTQLSLHQALRDLILEKRYDKITVQDIIDRANVGRSTFYAHFLDKEDLLSKGMRRFGEDFGEHVRLSEHRNETEHVLHSLVFFQHAYENRDHYRAMFDGGGRQFLLETGRQHITADIKAHLDRQVEEGNRLPVPLDVATHYFAGAMMSVLVWWVDSEMTVPPEEINAMFQSMALPSVQYLIGS